MCNLPDFIKVLPYFIAYRQCSAIIQRSERKAGRCCNRHKIYTSDCYLHYKKKKEAQYNNKRLQEHPIVGFDITSNT